VTVDYLNARRAARSIARRYGYELRHVREPNRQPDRVAVRTLIACVLRSQGYSLPLIGRVLCRHYTTVLHSLQRVERAQAAGVDSALHVPHKLWGLVEGR
jgi:chromosomal replication initiation ATPase DnaA